MWRIRAILHKTTSSAVILLLILLGLCVYMYMKSQSKELSTVTQTTVEQLAYTCCIPLNNTMRTNILFLKIHKTGSTTIQNIIYRFAQRYTLDILFPIYYLYYYQTPSSPTVWSGSETPNKKYHILTNHVRYHPQWKSNLYPGAVSITLMRHPVTLFRSVYEFFGMSLFTGMTLQQLLSATVKPKLWGNLGEYAYRGYNQMSVDLGFDLTNANDKTAVEQFIQKIDQEFDFVMITEYMDASLVLLANLMGWPLEYVIYIIANARPPIPNAYVLTEQDKETILELNHVDALLYHHFMQKFRKCVRQYGENKLKSQVLKLQEMNKQFEERCVARKDRTGLGGTVNYKPKDANDWECVQATKLQTDYEIEISKEQIDRMTELRKQRFPFSIYPF